MGLKRNLELVRDLMLQLESYEPVEVERSPWRTFGVTGHSNDEVVYHARLLLEQGFLYADACNLEAAGSSGELVLKCRPDAISNSGHDFVDTLRDPKVWKKTKEGALAAGGIGFDLLKDLGKGFLKSQIEERTGVKL